jgi:hypothetical protein
VSASCDISASVSPRVMPLNTFRVAGVRVFEQDLLDLVSERVLVRHLIPSHWVRSTALRRIGP